MMHFIFKSPCYEMDFKLVDMMMELKINCYYNHH